MDKKFGEKFSEKFGENGTQNLILAEMRDNPRISVKLIAERLGITQRAIEKNIRILKEKGIVERVGAAKGGKWVVRNSE